MKPNPLYPARSAALRKRAWLLLALSIVLVGAGGWWAWSRWRGESPPAPPPLDLEGVEEPVARALSRAVKKVQAEPDSPRAWGLLGKLLLAHHFLDQAILCFGHADRLAPQDPHWSYYRAHAMLRAQKPGGLDALREAAAHAARQAPGEAAPRLFLGETLLEQGKLAEAREQFESVRRIGSARVRATYGLALVSYHEGDYGRARELLEGVKGSPQTRRKARIFLAMLASARGEQGLADRYTGELARLPEDEPWPDPYLAEVQAMNLDQDHRLRNAYSKEDRGDRPGARQDLQVMIRDGAGDPAFSYLALADMDIREAQYAPAEEKLREALRLKPGMMKAHSRLAMVLFIQGERLHARDPERGLEKMHEAVRHARSAIAADPDHSTAHVVLGRSLFVYLGDREGGLAELRLAVKCRPESREAQLALGEALADAGEAEAEEHLRLAMKLSAPGDDRAKKRLEGFLARKGR